MIAKMKWPERTSTGPVNMTYLQERRGLLRWQEVVALGLEIAEVFEQSGKRALPREQNLELTEGGTVRLLRGRTHSGSAVTALARTLSSMLPKDRPTQLRLVLSTAGPDSASSKSMSEFVEALKYFERPGRRAVLAEVHQRALETPVPDDTQETVEAATDVPRTRKRPRWLVPAAAVLVLASVGLGSVSMFEQVAPGKVTDRLSALRAAATGAWSRVMEETEWMREAAAEDLSNVVDKVKAVTSEVKDAANERLGDDGDTPSDTDPAGEGPRVSKRDVARSQPQVMARADRPVPAANKNAAPDVIQTEPAVDVVVFGGEGGEGAENGNAHLMASVLFDSSDINVTPPVTLRLQIPTVDARATWRQSPGIVEAIISESGDVEKVRLVSPPESIHQSMILSAIKTWRFRPARKDGTTVRYRQLIPVAIPG